ncbi:carbohydrate ABC transporter permease [Actinomadura kijaniata]|uniref:Multiple sugar transport system permease protein n=1 Tax=Actinomadura namibiensis TaxID=182080 RepID=A0A7W3LWX6_ACTNM|nr:carbohydrate ABC transporter permease [Actinomadura namibiensis]MBA8955788.1 multiple sugar transport system permease protein [Actinomadura namibiensis]
MSAPVLTKAPAPPARRPAPAPRRRPALMAPAVVNAVLVVGLAYMLLPLTWLVIAATKDRRDLFGTGGFELARFDLWDNLARLFTENGGVYGRWLLNSVLYAGGGALVGALVCVAAGFAFDKYRFRGKERLYGLVLLGVLVPATATALPTYLLASEVGLVNSFWGVFLPMLVNPFGVYLARVFSASYVPDEVLEATRIDGASEPVAFWRVALPMLRPAFVTIFLFQFTAAWNNFLLPLLMLSDDRLYPVSLGLYMWNASSRATQPELYPLVVTGSLVAVVPLVLAFVLLQRHWRSGLTAGAVK